MIGAVWLVTTEVNGSVAAAAATAGTSVAPTCVGW